MSIDFSWLVAALQNVASNINNFFASLWTQASNIVNTGQGLFTGLVNFGGWLYQGLVDAFNSLYNGIKWLADQFRRGYEAIATYFYSALTFIGQNLFSFGQWLWSGIQGLANMIINGLIYIGGQIYNFFTNIGTTLYNAITSFKTSVDEWFFNIISKFREKIKSSVMFSVSTHIAWKSMEKIPEGKFVGGFMGLLASPIFGYLMSEIINSLLPSPSSPISPIPTTPSITMPSLVLEEKYPMPPAPSAPGALVVGVGVTPEETVISMSVLDKAVSPTAIATGEFETIGESSLTPSPTVTITTELITP
jgi:hypothetical protein